MTNINNKIPFKRMCEQPHVCKSTDTDMGHIVAIAQAWNLQITLNHLMKINTIK